MHSVGRIRLVGGPLDGTLIEADLGADEVVVSMVDRTRHLYRAESHGAGTTDLPAFVYVGRLGPD